MSIIEDLELISGILVEDGQESVATAALRVREYANSLRSPAVEAPKLTLLPCPFCGGKPFSHRTVNGTEMFKIGCAGCGFEFKAAWYRGEPAPTKDIVSVWNHRASLPASVPPGGAHNTAECVRR